MFENKLHLSFSAKCRLHLFNRDLKTHNLKVCVDGIYWTYGSLLFTKVIFIAGGIVIYFSDTFLLDGNLLGAREIAAFPAPLQFFLNYGLGCVFCFGTECGRDAGGWHIAKWQLLCDIFFDYCLLFEMCVHSILMTTQPTLKFHLKVSLKMLLRLLTVATTLLYVHVLKKNTKIKQLSVIFLEGREVSEINTYLL